MCVEDRPDIPSLGDMDSPSQLSQRLLRGESVSVESQCTSVKNIETAVRFRGQGQIHQNRNSYVDFWSAGLFARRDTQTHRHADTQTHTRRHTDTQIHRHIHIDTQTYRHTDTQTHRHIDTQIYRHIDMQTYSHTDTQTHRHTDT